MTTPPPPEPTGWQPPAVPAPPAQGVWPPHGYPPPAAPPSAYPVAYGAPGWTRPPAARRPVRAWDVIVTIVLLVLVLGLTAVVSFAGLFLVMAADPCGVRDCSTDLIGLGVLLAVGLPWVFLVVGAVVSIVLLVRRRTAFWVPLATALFVVGSLFFGGAIAALGVPSG